MNRDDFKKDAINLQKIEGPVYDKVKLEEKATSINLEQNIAYEQVQKF